MLGEIVIGFRVFVETQNNGRFFRIAPNVGFDRFGQAEDAKPVDEIRQRVDDPRSAQPVRIGFHHREDGNSGQGLDGLRIGADFFQIDADRYVRTAGHPFISYAKRVNVQ